MTDDALGGLRVIDLSEGVSGSYCAKLLADFGARVIKVEPPAGDIVRSYGPFPDETPDRERSGLFLYLNTNKQGITLDLDSDAGVEALRDLVRSADVLIESFMPGVIASMGLSYEELAEANPGLVMTSLTGFGQEGPYRDYQATHLINCALSGWAYQIGEQGRAPLQTGGLISEYVLGIHGAIGTLAAYHEAATSGIGQHVDVCAQEALQIMTVYSVSRYAHTGVTAPRPSAETRHVVVECRDGLIGCNTMGSVGWEPLCEWIGHPELLDDPELMANPMGRMQRVAPILEEFLRDRTSEEIFYEAQSRRIPFSMVPTVEELLDFVQHRERDYFVDIDHAAAGRLRYPGAPFKLGETPATEWNAAPLLGQHNAEILCDELGYGAQDLPQLTGSGGATAGRPRLSRKGGRPPARPVRPVRPDGAGLPLEGIRIVDATWVMAGPTATEMLADLGAEVIKVESIQRVDLWRNSAGMTGDVEESPNFNTLNRNKYGITLDLADQRGADIFRQLVADADIVAENFTPRVMPKFGLDYESLTKVKPDLIMLSMPSYGLTGPWRDFLGFAFPTEQMAGIAQLNGYADGPPILMGGGSCDAVSGLNGSVALLTALAYRQRTGRGQHIDLGQVEACTTWIGEEILGFSMNGRNPERRGNRHRTMAPHGVYRCEGEARLPGGELTPDAPDMWVAIAVRSDEDWRRFTEALGSPEWALDERFANVAGRLEHQDEIDARITEWTNTLGRRAVMCRLQEARVPAGAVLNAPDVLADPHLRERGFFEWVERAGDGGNWYPRQPIRLSKAQVATRMPTPTMGQHNVEILQGWLGMADEEIEELTAAQVIGTRPLSAPTK